MFKQPKMVKIFTTVTGDTSNAHRTFLDNVAAKVSLIEVQRWEECDVIMKFCPVSSRPGPDIDAALKDNPANKPAVLVVMHHTYDPNRSVYDSSNYVKQSDVLSVDCLFYEAKGLFRCPANEEAVEKTITHIRKYSKERPPAPVLTEQGEKQVAPGNENELRGYQRTSSLREKISDISQRAAENLCGVSDAQISTLTLRELTELLPGKENFQKRREIMDLFRQHFELQVSEVLREHRQLLKEQERQLQAALETTRLRIDLLDKLVKQEELPRKQPREGTKSPESVASNGEPSRSSPLNQNPHAPLADHAAVLPDENTTSSGPICNSSPPPVSSAPLQTDKKANNSSPVKVHISGDPPMGRSIFLNKLGVRITDSSLEQCSVILGLCPVTSLSEREIRAALSKIPDEKDVILVLIHQTLRTFNPRSFVEIRGQKRNIVEAVHYISYQSSGPTNYDVNDNAISRVRLALQKYGPLGSWI
ncbi:uncharacterized protein si:ch211-245h14.1 isoform X2 [Anguilla anguilla]|uniref:uncharacterized protein si:ch211-245h14.1 isoform X2 n=1 Tax=Anguilla anguilla TaxID=7936 RepID=UPI0015AB5802|nr:uncharacterized protein si:ch211-245h14.1 isoform X2 [Anguilla anguilla]